MARQTYMYGATVNGKRRTVIFHTDPADWGHELTAEGDTLPGVLTLADADMHVMNDHDAYRRFYADANPEDYEASHTEARLQVLIPARWQIIEESAS